MKRVFFALLASIVAACTHQVEGTGPTRGSGATASTAGGLPAVGEECACPGSKGQPAPVDCCADGAICDGVERSSYDELGRESVSRVGTCRAPKGYGSFCDLSAECREGLVCVMGRCTALPEGSRMPCTVGGEECGGGEICQPDGDNSWSCQPW